MYVIACSIRTQDACVSRRGRFRAFHERYYHPSNARFWFYGDDPPEERLALLGAFLNEFEARPVDSAITPQPLFSARLCHAAMELVLLCPCAPIPADAVSSPWCTSTAGCHMHAALCQTWTRGRVFS